MNETDKCGLAILAKSVRAYLDGQTNAETLVRAFDEAISDGLLPVMSASVESMVTDLHGALALFERSEIERKCSAGLIDEDELKAKVITFDQFLRQQKI